MPISLTVLILILFNIYFSFKGFNDIKFFKKFFFKINDLKKGEYYRLISSGFLHVDNQHLLFNMLTFYFFGDIVLNFLGIFWFYILYIFCLLSGNIFCFFINYQNNNYSAVGASGAVTGILFSAILFYPDLQLALLFFPIPMPGYFFAIIYLAYTFYGIKKQNDGIGHSAHLGGAIGGIFISLIYEPNILMSSFNTLALMIMVIFFGIVYFKKK
tara:strand:+ start:87 stop:728 length:642 start_codon:yes stop_codon:yes gene_type:complete